MNRILITGAAGYIGSTLTYKLLKAGYQVIGVDILKFGINPLLGALLNPNFQLVQCDICDVGQYEAYVDQDTAVVSLAAVVGEPACKKNPDEAVHTNYDGAKAVVRLAKEKRARKLIFATTCSNYGMVPQGAMADESSELHPLGLYAQSKVDIEKYLFEIAGDDLNWTILRFATVYGLGPRMRFDLTVNEFTAVGCTDKRLEVFLPHSVRPYVHVQDVARAIETVLLQEDKTRCQVYNVGDTAENYEKQQIVEEVQRIVPDMEVEYVDRGVDLRDYRVNFDKICKELSFKITMRVPDGVKEVYNAVTQKRINDIQNKNYYNHL